MSLAFKTDEKSTQCYRPQEMKIVRSRAVVEAEGSETLISDHQYTCKHTATRLDEARQGNVLLLAYSKYYDN